MSRRLVLVATDLTARSDRPIDRARALAQQIDGEVVVAHVVEHASVDTTEDARRLQAVRDSLPGDMIDTQIIVREGSPPQTLAQIAQDVEASIIVTGPARYNGLTDFVLGTAVDYLVRNADRPVLVVKNRPTRPYKTVLALTDLSDPSAQALRAGRTLLPDAAWSVLSAYSVPFEHRVPSDDITAAARGEAEMGLRAFLIAAGLDATVPAEVRKGDIELVAEEAVRTAQPDLVIIGSHARSGLVHATLGGRASSLLQRLPTDVLVVRRKP